MCSKIVMPADYEMLVSHSPPIFSHSPPAVNYMPDYTGYRFSRDTFSTRVPRTNCRGTSTPNLKLNTNCAFASQQPYNHYHYQQPQGPIAPSSAMPAAVPRRPCLVQRAEETNQHQVLEEEPGSPTRLKKKVVFADDRGMSLTHVRVMSEPSNVPPVWSIRFLAQVTQGLSADVTTEPWEITFSQPASDYVDFRRRLDQDNVSLENVIVREAEDEVVGTIKVRNLAFHKEVIVRSSSDDWKTHEDAFCKYVSNGITPQSNCAYILYDTFSFRLTLPPKSRRLEFCVCFRCGGDEFWDNNTGKNYILLKKAPSPRLRKCLSFDDRFDANRIDSNNRNNSNSTPQMILNVQKCSDAMRAKMDSWSEFASWTHLDNDTPYW